MKNKFLNLNSPSTNRMKSGRSKIFGFTLAEVLITLGIIGVVAAMTIPTLMNQTGQAEFKTGFKKAVSVLSQAITMNIALDSSDFSALTTSGVAAGSVYNMFNARMNVISTIASTTSLGTPFQTTGNYILFFNDGMAVTFPTDISATACTTAGQAKCRIVVDVNGLKKPNKVSAATSGNTTAGIYDEFVLDAYNGVVTPHDDKARYVMYN